MIRALLPPAPRAARAALALGTCAAPVLAQGPAFESPGMPTYATRGQTTRFSREFNPALGFVIDAVGDWLETDGEDGFDLSIRLLELNASAWVDPDAWAYVVASSEGGEAPEFEEAAVEYVGFEGNSTLKAGRFFVDFGKQMQSHLEELRTLERPAVLREYLGEELAGVGVQYGNWFAAGDATVVRYSLGAFAGLLGEGHAHGGEEDEGGEPARVVPERKDLDELSFLARLTGMTEIGEEGQLQLGLSARFVPEFAFDLDVDDADSGALELAADGRSNATYGLDATYGWVDETGLQSFTLGGEALVSDGDLAAEALNLDNGVIGDESLAVTDDSAAGFYAFADYGWNARSSVGVQYSAVEPLEDSSGEIAELDLYYTHHFTEFRRLRFGVTLAEDDVAGDFDRFWVQFTSFFGSHAHGVDW